jgi:hypothetical protein
MFTPQGTGDPRTLRLMWAGFLIAPVAYLVVGWVAAPSLTANSFPQPLTPILVLFGLGSVVLGNVLPGRLAAARPQTLLIVRWGCFEIPAVLGLVLLFFSGQLLAVVIGAGVSLALIAKSRPETAGLTGPDD